MKQRTGRTGAFYAKEASLQFKEDLQDSSLAAKRLEQSGKRWSQDELENNLDFRISHGNS